MMRSGLTPEERRRPQNEVGELAFLDRADVLRHAVGDRRVDGVFGDVALHPRVVVVALFFLEAPALFLHLVRRLPGADDDLA
jgi:hypothetical protein